MQFWKKDKPTKTEPIEPGMANVASGSNPIKFSEEPMFGSAAIPISEAQIPQADKAAQGEFVTHPTAFMGRKTPESTAVEPQSAAAPVMEQSVSAASTAAPDQPAPQAEVPAEPPKPPKKSFFGGFHRNSEDGAPDDDEEFAKKQKWIKARRRLVGALVLLVTAAVAIPLMFDKEPPPPSVTIPLRIPKESSVEVSKITIPSSQKVEVSEEKLAAQTKAEDQKAAEQAAKAKAEAAKPPVAPDPKVSSVKAGAQQSGAKKTDSGKADAKKPEAKQPEVKKPEAKPQAQETAKKEEAKKTQTVKIPKGQFYVQVVALSNEKRASDIVGKLKAQGLNAYLSPIATKKGKVWRVQMGPYKTRQEANAASAKLALSGMNPGNVLQVK